MKQLYFLLTKIFVVINLLVLFLTFIRPVFAIYQLMVINIVMVAILFVLYKAAVKGGSYMPFYIAMLWPGAGMLLLGIMDLLAKNIRSEGEKLAEYQKYIETMYSVSEAKALSAIDLVAEVNILSGVDEMSYSPAASKKEFILSTYNQEDKFKIGILKKALYDQNSEVKHYAATMLTAIGEQYERVIHDLKERAKRDPQALLALIALYDRYISSGFLAENIKKDFLLEYLALLTQARIECTGSDNIIIKLFNTHLELKMFDQAKALLPELEQIFHGQAFPHISAMRLYFCLQDYKKIAENALKIKELGLEIPDTYKPVIHYWSQE